MLTINNPSLSMQSSLKLQSRKLGLLVIVRRGESPRESPVSWGLVERNPNSLSQGFDSVEARFGPPCWAPHKVTRHALGFPQLAWQSDSGSKNLHTSSHGEGL